MPMSLSPPGIQSCKIWSRLRTKMEMSGRLFIMVNYLVINIIVIDGLGLFQIACKYMYFMKKRDEQAKRKWERQNSFSLFVLGTL